MTLLTGIVGVVNHKKLPSVGAKLILASLVTGLIFDFVGNSFTKWTGLLNYFIYNIYTFLSFIIYYYILYTVLKSPFHKELARLITGGFVCFFVINAVFFNYNFMQSISSWIYIYAVLGFLVLSMAYLIELYNSDDILHYAKSVYFWFVVGILVFHVPFLPFMLSVKFFLIDFNPGIFSSILVLLNILMSGCLIYGFICSKKKYNY